MGETRSCMVCGSPTHKLAELCKRCKRLRDRVDTRRRPNRAARVSALQQAWDGEGFRCYYTGIRLIEDDHHDPRYLTFDHRTPRNDEDVVVCAARYSIAITHQLQPVLTCCTSGDEGCHSNGKSISS